MLKDNKEKINSNILKWKVRFNTKFENEYDFLETILREYGVEDVSNFLHPRKEYCYNPFLMKHMKEAVEMFHEIMKMEEPKICIKADCDVDGAVSSSLIYNFICFLRKKNNKNQAEIEYIYSYNKEHGLTYNMLSQYVNNYFDLIIIPDASILQEDYRLIKINSPKTKILVLDHHNVELLNDENIITINCMDGQYPNPDLAGVGVVMKFCEAYCKEYNIDESVLMQWYDLVSTGIISDSMSLLSLENRYYVTEGLKLENQNNEFLNEIQKRKKEEFAFSRTPTNVGWVISPLINGVIRYGKKNEIKDLYRAMRGDKETIEYQPRRKSKNDPKPDVELHSLQWNMARICENVKARQDTAVRKFMEQIEEKIELENLDKNSVIFIDSNDIIDKKTVSGLVANKIASKYYRPVAILRDKSSTEYGGSGRGFDKGSIENFSELLQEAGVEVAGHANAFGLSFPKNKLEYIIKYCNEKYPLKSLEIIHSVSWEIPAQDLRKEYVKEVAESYSIWGNDIEQPTFAITNLEINASNIQGYGENNGFIRFEYKGIPFIKKYCKHDEFDLMTCKTRNILGKNKKNLVLNIIGQFILNAWEDKITPQVKILYFDSRENKEDIIDRVVEETSKTVKEKKTEKETEKVIKKQMKVVDIEDDDFIF